MQILILVLLAPLLLTPVLVRQIYHAALEWERAQIGTDNGAIILGESDSDLFNSIAASNRLIEGMEMAHHELHACAKIPLTAPECGPADAAMEAEIRLLHQSMQTEAKIGWRQNLIEGLSELTRQGVAPGRLVRSREVPLIGIPCPCGLEPYWEVDPTKVPIRSCLEVRAAIPLSTTIQLRGRSLRQGERWAYFLEAPPRKRAVGTCREEGLE